MEKETKITWNLFLISVAAYFVKFSLNIFLAHHLSADRYGDFKVAIQVLTILSGAALFGTNTSVLRYLAKYESERKKERAIDFIAWNFKLITITFTISFIVAFTALGLILLLHILHIKDFNQYHLAIYMFWLAPFFAVAILLSSYLLSESKVYFSSLMSSLLKYGIELLLFIMVVLLLNLDLNNNLNIIIPLLLSSLFLIGLGALFLEKIAFSSMKVAIKKMKGQSIIKSEWFSPTWKFISNNLIFMIICALDLIIIELFGQDESSVGYYAAISTCTGFIWLAPMNLYQVIKPKISSLIESRQGRVELQASADKTNKVVFFLTSLSFLPIILFATPLLATFGTDYQVARIPLIILSIGAFIRGISKLASLMLVYSGFEGATLKIATAELLIIAIGGAFATHYYGILGMAIITSLSLIIGAAFTVIYSHIKLGIRSVLFF